MSDAVSSPPNAPTPPARPAEPDAPRTVRRAALLLALLVLVVLAGRVLGPSDLHQNTDQSKTIAATADVVINGAWALPRDLVGEGLKKPPLLNWVGAPVVALFGWSELPLKAPAVLFGLTAAASALLAARLLLPRLATTPDRPTIAPPVGSGPRGVRDRRDALAAAAAPSLAIAAAALWIASPSGVKNIYFLRPDIALAAALSVGWLAAVFTLDRPARTRRERLGFTLPALAIWLAAAAAVLAKGPVALLVPIYAMLHALLLPLRDPADAPASDRPSARLRAKLSRLQKAGWWWGLPLMLAIGLAWLAAAHRADPVFVRDTLLAGEVLDRVHKGTGGVEILRIIRACFTVPGFFVERFALGGALWIFAIVFVIPPRRWRTHPLAPAVLWTLLITVTMILFAGRAGSYTAPAYPAAAVLAVYALARVFAPLTSRALQGHTGLRGDAFAALALIAALAALAQPLLLSRGAETRLGDRIKHFARHAAQTVGDETVAFLWTGHNPVPVLMGRHRTGNPTTDQLAAAQWLVLPLSKAPDGASPALTSEPLTRLSGDGVHAEFEGLALYHKDDIDPARIPQGEDTGID